MLRISDQRKMDRRGSVKRAAPARGVQPRVRLAETKSKTYFTLYKGRYGYMFITENWFKGCGGPRLGDRQQERRN